MSEYIEINFKPVKTKKASELIYEMIKDEIISGNIRPGDRLPSERVLIDKLERSRPTIREALRMLEREGLIKIVPGSGAVVTHLSLDSMTQSMETMMALNNISNAELAQFRQLNEAAFAQWAAKNCTAEDLAAMRECLESSAKHFCDALVFFEYDLRFHEGIFQATHNGIAVIIGKLLHGLMNKSLIKEYAGQSAQESQALCREIYSYHKKIFEAIEAHNEAEAEMWMRKHIMRFQEEMVPHEE